MSCGHSFTYSSSVPVIDQHASPCFRLGALKACKAQVRPTYISNVRWRAARCLHKRAAKLWSIMTASLRSFSSPLKIRLGL